MAGRGHRLGVVPLELVEAELDRAYALGVACIVALGAEQVIHGAENDQRPDKVLVLQVAIVFIGDGRREHARGKFIRPARFNLLDQDSRNHVCIL